jgi:hypothetical protein
MATLPGYRVFQTITPATTGASPIVSPFIDTTGYTNLAVSYFAANSTGATAVTVEGSFDGTTQDTDMTYAALTSSATAIAVVPLLHPYFRVRIVQTTANATTTKICMQSRA